MSQSQPDPATVAFLHSHGLDLRPQQLSELVRAAVEALPQDVRPGVADADLTRGEVEALKRGGVDLADRRLGEADPLALTAAKYAAILEDSFGTTAAAEHLRVKPSRVRQRLTAKPPTLYGIRVGSRWLIPRFQFHRHSNGQTIPGFEAILERLDPGVHPVAVFNWFTTPHVDLTPPDDEDRALSPREWLVAGYPLEAVACLAEDL